MAGIYKCIIVRCAVAYTTRYDYNLSDPASLLWNRTRCLRNEKRNDSNNNTQSSSSDSNTMYAYKLTSRWLRRHLNHHRTYFYAGTKKRGKCHTHKTIILELSHGRLGQWDNNLLVHLLRFLHGTLSDWYVSIRTNRRLGKTDKNENSTRRRVTTRARSRPLLAGSGGVSKVRHVQQSAHREVELISI